MSFGKSSSDQINFLNSFPLIEFDLSNERLFYYFLRGVEGWIDGSHSKLYSNLVSFGMNASISA